MLTYVHYSLWKLPFYTRVHRITICYIPAGIVHHINFRLLLYILLLRSSFLDRTIPPLPRKNVSIIKGSCDIGKSPRSIPRLIVQQSISSVISQTHERHAEANNHYPSRQGPFHVVFVTAYMITSY